MLRLHVVNTGWAHLWDKDLYWGGRKELRALPVLAFIIEHPRGLFIFDTGLDPSMACRPKTFTTHFSDRAVRFHSSSQMALSQQMRQRGLPPEEVQWVALSHLHCDHTGDLRAFSQASVLVTHQEWRAARSPLGRRKGYWSEHYAGLAPTLVDLPTESLTPNGALREHCGIDCLGDGSLFLVPTFGHTAGHQALLVLLPQGVVLLAGDAVYVREGYLRPAAQPRAQYPDVAWRSLIALRALAKADPSAIIIPAHDGNMLLGLARQDIVVDPTSLIPPAVSPGGGR